MKIIIAGSRTFKNYQLLSQKMDNFTSGFSHTEITIISGGARGADLMGERYASERGFNLEIMKANWDQEGKGAGYRRNERMAEKADGLVAFWDGASRGTKHMIDLIQKQNKPFRIVKY